MTTRPPSLWRNAAEVHPQFSPSLPLTLSPFPFSRSLIRLLSPSYPSPSLYLNPLWNHRLPSSRSRPRVSLFRSFCCSLSPRANPSSRCLPELSATGSSSVRRSIGILHPVPPLTRWRRTKVLTLMFHSRCCLLTTLRVYSCTCRRHSAGHRDANFVRKMRRWNSRNALLHAPRRPWNKILLKRNLAGKTGDGLSHR